jgi:hypothetical protein
MQGSSLAKPNFWSNFRVCLAYMIMQDVKEAISKAQHKALYDTLCKAWCNS